MIIIEGRNPVLESLRSGQLVSDVYIKEGAIIDKKISEILNIGRELRVRYKFVSKKFLDNLSPTGVHQGVIALRQEKAQRSLQEFLEDYENQGVIPFVVYVREAQNEYNVGSIIRSAECAGANLIILPPKTHLTPQMVRASMGASEHIEIINENLFSAIKVAQKWAVKVVGIELSGKKYYYESDLKGALMLVIGGEDRSLSGEVAKKCDFVVKIPQKGQINSLNMGVAAAIVIYEKLKQEIAG